jgi:hypothetical protein
MSIISPLNTVRQTGNSPAHCQDWFGLALFNPPISVSILVLFVGSGRQRIGRFFLERGRIIPHTCIFE